MAVESKQQQQSTTTTLPLSSIYPINTQMELTLDTNNNNNTVVRGTIYCTDEISNTIVLKQSLVHTTLSSEITVINAAVVTGCRVVKDEDSSSSSAAAEQLEEEEEEKILPNVSRRMVEERERRAIKLMEESFSHVNQKVSTIVIIIIVLGGRTNSYLVANKFVFFVTPHLLFYSHNNIILLALPT